MPHRIPGPIGTNLIAGSGVTLTPFAGGQEISVGGKLVQSVFASDSSVKTGTGQVTATNRLPVVGGEGTVFMIAAITPNAIGNILLIEANANFAHTAISRMRTWIGPAASGSNALIAIGGSNGTTANAAVPVYILASTTAASVASQSYVLCHADTGAGTWTMNGESGAGVNAIGSYMRIAEYTP